MTSQEYWKERETRQRKNDIKNEREYRRHIEEIYQNMIDEIEKEINGFYGKYARKEGITITEAKKRAAKADIEAFGRKAKRYVKDKDFSKQANEEMRLYNMTMKVNRLELLKAQIGLEMVAGFDELEKYYKQVMTDQVIEEFERQAGILGKTVSDRMKAADAIVNSSFHNATFSDRIWMYQDMLKNELNSLLQTGLIQGQNPRRLATHLQKRFGVSQSNTERLMITELARVQTEAQKQSFERNGFEEYTFLALGNACSKCKKLDEKHFKVKDMMPGENAPPMHPYCRCSTAAYEDSESYEAWLDFLSKGGTTEEWNRMSLSSDKITDEDIYYLNQSKSFQSYIINEKLREEMQLSEEENKIVRGIDAAIAKLPDYEGIVYRSIGTQNMKDVPLFEMRHQPGKIVTYHDYTSSSLKVYDSDMEYQLIIKSKHGKDMVQYNPNEEEIIFKRETSFFITKREGNMIWMEEI
nr:minor capsid protein [uncultured Anaerostipes sp.]